MANEVQMLKEMHRNLALRYQDRGPQIESTWQSWDQARRTKALGGGSQDGKVMATPTDESMGGVFMILPEWNLLDLAAPNSDYMLDILKFRVATSLVEQYQHGPNGKPGDHAAIIESQLRHGLKHPKESQYGNSFTMFLSEETYGSTYKITDPKKYEEVMDSYKEAVQDGSCVSQATGNLILQRQLWALKVLDALIDDILDEHGGGSV